MPRIVASLILSVTALAGPLSACSHAPNRYVLVEESLRTGDTKRADQIIANAADEYGKESRVLYRMDRGMTLHWAGRYQESNVILEEAEEDVEQLYTRRLRTETKAFLINDSELPYEGEPYEQVMLNVQKALNYAVAGGLEDALVEARRVDHRLNVLSDRTGDKEGYREDAFARYLTGILYEAAGDTNNALIAYRKAYETYRLTRPWSHVPVPSMLRSDLLRVTDALPFTQEHEEYRQAFPNVSWQPLAQVQQLAQIVVVSYNGRAPYKEDSFIDLPVNLDALNLVLAAKRTAGASEDRRVVESMLYGLNGHVVRVALPRLVPQKTQVAYGQVILLGADHSFGAKTEVVQSVASLAERNLSDRFARITIKAVARAAVKYALAEGAGYGARAAVQSKSNDVGPLVGLIVSSLAHAFAVSSEEADKRSWRTLPDEIHIARLWVPPGSYELRVRSVSRTGKTERESARSVTLLAGETKFFTERVLP